jgi:serine protease Do
MSRGARAPRTAPRAALVLAWALALAWALGLPGAAWADRASRVTPTVEVVRSAAPAVVNISTESRRSQNPFSTGDKMLDRFFREFFQPHQRQHTSLGSGVIIDGAQGLIVTNAHVVEQGGQITVHLADKRKFRAQVVGADPEADLALLRIEARADLPQVRLGDSDGLMIGETLIAIGNPFGLQHTVTTGVVSALHRRVRAGERRWLDDLIQTDASINPGNSGGPILNLDGEVVGINTAIFARAQGIGFAIPVNRLKRVVADLAKHGEVIPVWLGLRLQDLTPALAGQLGLSGQGGVLVRQVDDDSPASRAGLRRGQVIVAMDGRRVDEVADYRSRLKDVAAGQVVELVVVSGGRRQSRRLTAKAFPLERAQQLAWQRLGFTVREMTAADAQRHRVRPGSAVVIHQLRPGSEALGRGLKPGDLVRKVGESPVASVAEFGHQLARHRLMGGIPVLVQRGRAAQYLTLGP